MTATRSSNIIEPIANRKFVNVFHCLNDPNHQQYVHKHTDQHYQYRPFQISNKFSLPYLKVFFYLELTASN